MTIKNIRKDLLQIANLVQNKSHILEIGCGTGELLEFLTINNNIDGKGIELKPKNVSICVKKGLSVIQGDADEDLQFYPNKCFDFAISSDVIQATKDPKYVLQQMLRVAKKIIVSTPNFGFWYNRYYLGIKGKMPVSKTLKYQWYDTPNIHFSTAKDFENLCSELNFKIIQKIYLNNKSDQLCSKIFPNLLAEKCIYLIED